MKKFYLFYLLCFLASSPPLRAQDPYFSQFFANRVFLNPAYAGFDPGTTATLNYRDQWFGLPDGQIGASPTGFRTYSASVDMQFPCLWDLQDVNLGMALTAFRDAAGSAPLVSHGFGAAFSHEQPLLRRTSGKLQRLDLRVGMQTAFIQKRLEDNYFIYSSQLDPVAGLLGDPTVLGLRSNLFANLNAGAMLRGYLRGDRKRETLFTVGFNLANVNQPNESLLGAAGDTRLPRRSTFHLGFSQRITRFKGVQAPLYLAPQFRWDRQAGSKLNLHTLGAYVLSKGYYTGLFLQYNFPNAAAPAGAPVGGNFLSRNTTTLIFNAGIDVRSLLDNGKPWRKRDSGWLLGFSYDLNLAGIQVQNTLGVVEMSESSSNHDNKFKRIFCHRLLPEYFLELHVLQKVENVLKKVAI